MSVSMPLYDVGMKTCSLEGCPRPYYGQGYCNPHYKRWRNTGDPGPSHIEGRGRGSCSFEGCIETHSAKGLCATHYAQNQRGKTLTPIAYRGSPKSAREIALKSRYGITAEDYDDLLSAQGGGCALCHGVAGARRFHVDHDHKCCPGSKSCGQCVRALLCGRCNAGLGQFRESPELLRAAIVYLERHGA